MNRNIVITILLLSLGAGRAAFAQETNAGAAPARISLQTIMQKNIFDPTRSGGRVRGGSARRAVVVRTFSYHGTMDDVACFTGEGTPSKGWSKEGDLINGFKIMKITLDFVILADPDGKLVQLAADDSMRRDEDGPWYKSDQPAPLVIASSEAKTDESPESSSPGPADESDILKKLRLKREQEDK
jgi:hypothetical protein